jgi:hypothetical protein
MVITLLNHQKRGFEPSKGHFTWFITEPYGWISSDARAAPSANPSTHPLIRLPTLLQPAAPVIIHCKYRAKSRRRTQIKKQRNERKEREEFERVMALNAKRMT